jgi:hypothetical protein
MRWPTPSCVARREAVAPEHQYLSALFLGAVLERRRDLAGARAAYERALAVNPSSQAATVALGYLDVMAGRPDRAQEVARAYVTDPNPVDEWWAYQNGGFDRSAMDWLRRQVQP